LAINPFPVIGPKALGIAPGLISALRAAEVDIVHSHGLWMYPSIASLIVTQRAARSVISPHGMLDPWALRNSAWKKRLAAFAFERSHLHRAGCLHALVEPELVAIRKAGIETPVCVIPNGVVLPEPVNRAEQASVRGKMDRRVLLYIGRLHPKKGLHTLLEAWSATCSRVVTAREEWTLRIVGWEGLAGYERKLRRIADELQLTRQVVFSGPLYGAAKNAALQCANGFVLPSVSEGMPVAVLEAWAHYLPVVMTPYCNIPSGFTTGAAICSAADTASLTRALTEFVLLGDGDRAVMGSRGRALVERDFTWRHIARTLLGIYEWLVGGGKAPACVQRPRSAAYFVSNRIR
jgi:poly(glycerol-phosphate) alpha-glucosyltransferase